MADPVAEVAAEVLAAAALPEYGHNDEVRVDIDKALARKLEFRAQR